MKQIMILRQILTDVYEYQLNTPGVNINALEEESVIKYISDKYNSPAYNKVKTKIDELRKEGLISNTGTSGTFEITTLGYRIRRSLLSTILLVLRA